ncbi:ATP-grasp peptide maturase system methyltransferase [Streptomyces aculeolatus]
MNPPDARHPRVALADRLADGGHLPGTALRDAVAAEARENYLLPGVFLPTSDGRWWPVTPEGRAGTHEWLELAYSDRSLVTQLDGHLTADQTDGLVDGFPTSSSTLPETVVRMIGALEPADGMRVLEVGTGTGYSTALLCRMVGADHVTSVEVDPAVAARADDALERAGHSTWTVVGDGLLGHPARAPYDRVVATCAVRRIPYAWIRQTRPGGVVLATLGSWTYGTGLARVTVGADGTAEGRIVGRASFMPARAQAAPLPGGDLTARAAYADSERTAEVGPDLLADWTPAFLAQLAAPNTQMVTVVDGDGGETVYLVDTHRESFATLCRDGARWRVRQGGPVALWDDIEGALTAWRGAGEPDVDAVRLHVTRGAHVYWIGDDPALRWEHRLA